MLRLPKLISFFLHFSSYNATTKVQLNMHTMSSSKGDHTPGHISPWIILLILVARFGVEEAQTVALIANASISPVPSPPPPPAHSLNGPLALNDDVFLGLAINAVLKSPNALASCHDVRPAELVEAMGSALIQRSNGHIDLRLDQPLYTAPGMSIAVRAALYHRFLNSCCLIINTLRLYTRLLLKQQARSLMPLHYRQGSQRQIQSQTVALKLQCLLHHPTGGMAHRLPHSVQVLRAAHHRHTRSPQSVINYD